MSEKGLSIFSIFLELRRWGLEAESADNKSGGAVQGAMCGQCQPFIEDKQ